MREVILRGELPAGARLGEVELAERFGVSRTPVREALSRLAAEGLVEIQRNRGARVASWSVEELESVFELRGLLEPRLTALAVPRATPADPTELDRLAHDMFDVGCPGPAQDLDALVPLNRAFHDRLVALAASPRWPPPWPGPCTRRSCGATSTPTTRRSLRRSLAHHVEIVAALRAGDADWAHAVMTAHIRNARAVMVRAAGQAATSEQPTNQEEAP